MYNTVVLKFSGSLLTDREVNANRNFVIIYYLADKSVHIYENEVKNNGFTPGKFIEKMKYKNMKEGGRLFEPIDFVVGNTILINSFEFLIKKCDKRTEDWFHDHM